MRDDYCYVLCQQIIEVCGAIHVAGINNPKALQLGAGGDGAVWINYPFTIGDNQGDRVNNGWVQGQHRVKLDGAGADFSNPTT